MTNYVEALKDTQRLLLEVSLKPLQGKRFQATGFPDLGPATFTTADGMEMLLVESTQSMANRMEAVCWDDQEMKIAEDLQGVPYIKVNLPNDSGVTSSILEGHRMDSQYILDDTTIKNELKAIAPEDKGPVDLRNLYTYLLKNDPNTLIHGVFLEDVSGRLRFPRALSSFIEAENVKMVQSGGVFFDHVLPKNNVPYSRTEFLSEKIIAYFNLDIQQILNYNLPESGTNFLILLAFYKIRKVLNEGLKLRSFCDLEMVDDSLTVTRPKQFELPDPDTIRKELKAAIKSCEKEKLFNDPAERIVNCKKVGKKTERTKE